MAEPEIVWEWEEPWVRPAGDVRKARYGVDAGGHLFLHLEGWSGWLRWFLDNESPSPDTLGQLARLALRVRELEAELKPNLGLATTAELLSELMARAEVGGYAGYKTVGGEGLCLEPTTGEEP